MIFGKARDHDEQQRLIQSRRLKAGYEHFCWFPVLLNDGRYAWLCDVISCQERFRKDDGSIGYAVCLNGEPILTHFVTWGDLHSYIEEFQVSSQDAARPRTD